MMDVTDKYNGFEPEEVARFDIKSNEDIALIIAEKANCCCHRSDGWKEEIYQFVLALLDKELLD